MSKGSDKLAAFVAANPNPPSMAKTHPERVQAFHKLRELFDSLPGAENECTHCGLSLAECVQWSPDGCPDAS